MSSDECEYCGAVLPVRALGKVHCTYCRRPAPRRPDHPQSAPTKQGAASSQAIGTAIVCLGVVAGGATLLGSNADDEVSAVPMVTEPEEPPLTPSPPAEPEQPAEDPPPSQSSDTEATDYYVDSHLLRLDLNGDGVLDLVLHVTRDRKSRYLALDGKTNQQLWRTPGFDDRKPPNAAVTSTGHLFAWADRGATLTSYPEGRRAWATPMGEEIKRICTSKEPHHVVVDLADGRRQRVDQRSGAQASADGAGPCHALPMLGPNSRPIVRDALQQSTAGLAPEAFPGAISCSSGLLITPAGMVRQRNPCRAKLAGAKKKGFGIDAMFPVAGGKWVLLGTRYPGTAVPMVGMGAPGRIDWAREVPKIDPTTATTGMPLGYAVLDGLVVVADDAGPAARLVAFALPNGEQAWELELQGARAPIVYPFGDQVLAVQGSQLLWVDAKGEVARRWGRGQAALDLSEPANSE